MNSNIAKEIEIEFKNKAVSNYSVDFLNGFLELIENQQDEKEDVVVSNLLNYLEDNTDEGCNIIDS